MSEDAFSQERECLVKLLALVIEAAGGSVLVSQEAMFRTGTMAVQHERD